jgi:hypothetical protein
VLQSQLAALYYTQSRTVGTCQSPLGWNFQDISKATALEDCLECTVTDRYSTSCHLLKKRDEICEITYSQLWVGLKSSIRALLQWIFQSAFWGSIHGTLIRTHQSALSQQGTFGNIRAFPSTKSCSHSWQRSMTHYQPIISSQFYRSNLGWWKRWNRALSRLLS